MARDRFLTGILAGIVVLVVLALTLFYLRQNRATLVDDGSVEGTLQSYLIALQQGDYVKAYSYLAEDSAKPTFMKFQEPFLSFQSSEVTNTMVEFGETIIDEQTESAIVKITLVRGGRGLFSEIYREAQTAQLARQGGLWKITSLPYPFWSYDWIYSATPIVGPKPSDPQP